MTPRSDAIAAGEPPARPFMTLEEDARYNIRFRLLTYRRKPPTKPRPGELASFYGWAAEGIVQGFRESGWLVEPGKIRKKNTE
jgi:hypothetical protein